MSLEITVRANTSDYELFVTVVNQGIDEHLEAFTESEFSWADYDSSRLYMGFDDKEIPLLLRRLRELGTAHADSWADDIETYLSDNP